ncbi:hypothetical protein [Candidatus Enterococcus mansonii]|uniref:WxL domain-containing protein n=1 Tax=Candidatus Enterococcus mansonii TaxID=1834181 RepID=A0A242CJC5_9ENTE|nr:hypothetical protein [Enterococcus sp. 4G2_DIV0659]OTO10343.1 hypothetical protein A5880_001027 [Enterococcus sp. 4G2_DIV0659]
MKKKRKLCIRIVMFLSIVWCINTTLSTFVEAAEVWLPESPYWLDSLENEIPKENTFTPMWTNKSKIIGYSDGMFVNKEGQGKLFPYSGYIPFGTKKAEWIKISNVGYYNNSTINMKITIKTAKPSMNSLGSSMDSEFNNTVSIKSNFGSVYAHINVESAALTYEFFDDQDHPVNVSGHWVFKDAHSGNKYTINKSWVEKIYSVSRSYTEKNILRPVVIKVDENAGTITMGGTERRASLVGEKNSVQSQAVITYNNRSKIDFTVAETSSNPYIILGYTSDIDVVRKVEYPAPAGREKIVKSISKDSAIDQEFSQYLPYQSEKARTQELSWEIDAPIADSLVVGDWEVTNEEGTNSTALFSITTTNGKTTIKPKDKSQVALYGHYFYFKRKVSLSKTPIDETLLKERESGKYLDTKGTVTMHVDDKSDLKTTFKTNINFLATVTYHYLDQKINQPIPNLPDTIKTEMTSLLTHPYPLKEGGIVPGYAYLSASPTNVGDQVIKYSQEEVSFLYGKLTIQSKRAVAPLGMDTTTFTPTQLKNLIDSAKYGTNELTSYELGVVKAADTSVLTNDTVTSAMTIKLTTDLDGKHLETHFDVSVDVTWGNSIALGGSGTTIGESTLALSLHEDENQMPYIAGSYGNISVDRTTPLDGNNQSDTPYYQVTYLDMSKKASGINGATEVSNKPQAPTDVLLSASNQSTPFNMLAQFKQKTPGMNGRLSVHYDDVIGIYVTPQDQQALYMNNQGPSVPLKGLPNQKSIFYRITKTGFVPLYLDHLERKNVSITTKETESSESYNAHYDQAGIDQYFSIPSANHHYAKIVGNGFKTYPKQYLAVTEDAKGQVYVAEQLSEASNKYLKYPYELSFTGYGPDFNVEKPQTLDFGTPGIRAYRQEIKQANPEWQLKVLDNRLTKTSWEIQARVTQPLQATVGDTTKELKGAFIKLKDKGTKIPLNQTMQNIYITNRPEMNNLIQWKDLDGFYLSVPPSVMQKDLSYQTNVEFLLSVGP